MPVFLFAKFAPFLFAATCSKPDFFFLPPWYEYLNLQTDTIGQCAPVFHPPGDIWLIALAIIDMLLRLAGFIAVISIIIAGFEYVSTVGNAEKGISARKRVVNSIIGLAIVLVATGLVSFIGNSLGG